MEFRRHEIKEVVTPPLQTPSCTIPLTSSGRWSVGENSHLLTETSDDDENEIYAFCINWIYTFKTAVFINTYSKDRFSLLIPLSVRGWEFP